MVEFAEDIAVPVGTPLVEAISTTLAVAAKAVANGAQRNALAALTKVIRDHESA